MTAPATFHRAATDVQAMRLTNLPAMAAAAGWVRDHGIGAVVTEYALWISGGNGTRMVAHLGDWLTLDGAGEFSVYGAAEFARRHEGTGL